jgi:hypothetical protein
MDAAPPAAPGTAETLQFETAAPVPGAAPAACAACRAPVGEVYHVANGQVICSRCRTRLEGGDGGTPVARLAKAALYGTGAAIAGMAIYMAWFAATNLDFSLIAILVGWIVGTAIHRATGARGGWPYQVMAVGLTYLAISLSYLPAVIGGYGTQPGALTGAALYVSAAIDSLVWPVQSVVRAPITAVVIAIGLWQAWRQTRGPKLVISGPYFVNGPKQVQFNAPIRG